MNKYTLVHKKNYRPFRHDPIMFDEYMIFKNNIDDSFVLLPKWINQTAYLIEEITVLITQLNAEDDKIASAKYTFGQLNMGPFKTLVTLEKISVDQACTHVQVNLIHAKAKDRYWKDGAWRKEENQQNNDVSIINTQKVSIETVISNRISFPIYISFIVLLIYVMFVVGAFYAINR